MLSSLRLPDPIVDLTDAFSGLRVVGWHCPDDGLETMVIDDDEVDPIAPVAIVHSVDELWSDESKNSLSEKYNYLVYHFERDGLYCWAKHYLDLPNSADLHGPYSDRDYRTYKPSSDLIAACTSYLRRRYINVEYAGAIG